MNDVEFRQRVRRARGKFAAMATAYGLGVFNDSLYRQSAMLIAVAAGRSNIQGWTMFIFTLPYLIFASPAGWLADRFPKRRVVIGAKVMELVAMICGAVGICTGNWPLILVMVFVMAWQSCLFSPALNGSIPELYPAEYVTKANATLKVVVTPAIILGVGVASVVIANKTPGWAGVAVGRWGVAIAAVAVSALGVAASLFVASRPAASPSAPFPWRGPVNTLRELGRIYRDSLLRKVVIADVFVWSVGALLMMLVNRLVKDQLHLSEAVAGYLMAVEVIGIATGGLIGGRLAVGPRWHRILPVALALMGGLMIAASLTPLLPAAQMLSVFYVLMGMLGIAGGMCMIPCEAFVQVRAEPSRKGAVIASVNFVIFAGIALSGLVDIVLRAVLLPTQAFAVIGAAALVLAGWLTWALRRGPAK